MIDPSIIQEYTIREHLFEVLKKDGCYKEAATALDGLNLDSVSRTYSNAEKADIYVKIAETYLVEDEAVSRHVNKRRDSDPRNHLFADSVVIIIRTLGGC